MISSALWTAEGDEETPVQEDELGNIFRNLRGADLGILRDHGAPREFKPLIIEPESAATAEM